MLVRRSLILLSLSLSHLLAGCAPSIYRLRIPMSDGVSAPVAKAERRVVVEDARSAAERRPHRGRNIMSCERWFGDDTIVPSKMQFLAGEISHLTRSDMQVHVRVTRFDIVEYCEFVPVGEGTGATRAVAGSNAGVHGAPTTGDTVVMRLAGDVNGTPFDLESRFDYGLMYRFPNPPSSSPEYLGQFRGRLEQLAKDVANIVWNAEIARISQSRKP